MNYKYNLYNGEVVKLLRKVIKRQTKFYDFVAFNRETGTKRNLISVPLKSKAEANLFILKGDEVYSELLNKKHTRYFNLQRFREIYDD